MPTGMDLKVERIRARITITDLAAQMGVSRQRISQVEGMSRVSPTMVDRYRAGLLQVAETPQTAQGVA